MNRMSEYVRRYFTARSQYDDLLFNRTLLGEAERLRQRVRDGRPDSRYNSAVANGNTARLMCAYKHGRYSDDFDITLHSLMLNGGGPGFQRFGASISVDAVADHILNPEQIPVAIHDGCGDIPFSLPFDDGHYSYMLRETRHFDFRIEWAAPMEQHCLPVRLVVFDRNGSEMFDAHTRTLPDAYQIVRLFEGVPMRAHGLDWKNAQATFVNEEHFDILETILTPFRWLLTPAVFPPIHGGDTVIVNPAEY